MITSPTGANYVGQSIDVNRRITDYKRLVCIGQPKLYNSFKLYGVKKHKFSILVKCKKDALDAWEIFYIKLFDSIENGMNCKEGGHRAPLSLESRQKLSNSLIKTNANPEVKEKRAAWQRGRKMSKEAVEKMRLSKVGKPGHPNQIASATGNTYASKGNIEVLKDGILVHVAPDLYAAAHYVNGDFRNVHRSIKTGKRHKGHLFKRQMIG